MVTSWLSADSNQADVMLARAVHLLLLAEKDTFICGLLLC